MNGDMEQAKATVVKGNVLRLRVALTLRTLSSTGTQAESSEVDFVPKAGSVTARLINGARGIGMSVESEGNYVYLTDYGKLAVGSYALEILCRDEQDNPFRCYIRDAVEVFNATACAGINPGVEFDAVMQYLGATFTQMSDGTPVDLSNYYTKDEIDAMLSGSSLINAVYDPVNERVIFPAGSAVVVNERLIIQ